ncbi:threonine/serine exporter family protein [Streptomyces sp. NPDC006624]|uniref:threonine/serine ThrE exporter family protein n=1 Tax=unclassified Streptomyces TaxID=2593676 RepID=UPI0033AA99AF
MTPPERQADLTGLSDLLAHLAELLIRTSGEGAEMIAWTLSEVARAYGGSAESQLVPDAATVTVALGGRTHTFVVTARPDVARLDRVAEVKRLVEAVRTGNVTLPDARLRLAAIAESPDPYPRWLRLAGIVMFSVGFAPVMQATWYEIGTTAVTASLVALLVGAADVLPRLRLVLPLVAAVCVSALVLLVFARDASHGSAILLMLPALFFFVPGDYLSAAVAETVAGYVTTGAIRLVYAAALLLQLYVGIVVGAALTGTPLSRFDDFAAAGELSRWVVAGTWAVFAMGTVFAFGIPFRLSGWVLFLAYLTLTVQAAATKAVGEDGGTFAAAVVLSATAALVARRPGRPPRLPLVLAGFFTLTVGSLGLRGLTTLIGGHPIEGFQDLLDLVTTVTIIAAGMLLGAALVRSPGHR